MGEAQLWQAVIKYEPTGYLTIARVVAHDEDGAKDAAAANPGHRVLLVNLLGPAGFGAYRKVAHG